MNKADAKRVDRLINDLGWLADQSGIELDGEDRDAIGHLRFILEEALDAA